MNYLQCIVYEKCSGMLCKIWMTSVKIFLYCTSFNFWSQYWKFNYRSPKFWAVTTAAVVYMYYQYRWIVIIFSYFVFIQIQEMEITRTAAERSLRENKGDVVQALLQLVNWELICVKNLHMTNFWIMRLGCFVVPDLAQMEHCENVLDSEVVCTQGEPEINTFTQHILPNWTQPTHTHTPFLYMLFCLTLIRLGYFGG